MAHEHHDESGPAIPAATLPAVNETHDPSLQSCVESANEPGTDFPIQNLPLVTFDAEHDGHSHSHLGVLIGDQVLDLGALVAAGVFDDDEAMAYLLHTPVWNYVASQGQAFWKRLRIRLQDFLRVDRHAGQQARRLRQKALRPIASTVFDTPMDIGNYTDFYASKHHATNVGAMFRPDNPLLPNYKHIPIGYHGRASTVIPSGAEIRRPKGQQSPPDNEPNAGPVFGPCKMLDYEMEIGAYVGAGNRIGDAIPMSDMANQLFGLCIVNDWSARDVQKWEYQPLGPFLAKNFATTVSPSIVTMEALAPFLTAGPERDPGDPEPLPYLRTNETWGVDLTVEVWLRSAKMRDSGTPEFMLSRGNFQRMYWTLAQMLAHHASNGCSLQPGDLIASGTISGPEKFSRGCLLELTWDGTGKPRVPINLPTGESRTFLQDGDEVIMRAYAQREGFRRIGFGECRGTILPARD